MDRFYPENKTPSAILRNIFCAAISLFINGFGIYLTIQANIGAAPWDVFSLGLSRTLGILYGTASVAVSVTILVIDLLLREPIGIAMVIDAVVVGKSVDLFNFLQTVPKASSLLLAIPMMILGLFIIAYTQYTYMRSALGCGPRDTLLVGLSKRFQRIPIGMISIALLTFVTVLGALLGGPVGIGTLICAFLSGPIMQFSFRTVHFDAAGIPHQHMTDSLRILFSFFKRS